MSLFCDCPCHEGKPIFCSCFRPCCHQPGTPTNAQTARAKNTVVPVTFTRVTLPEFKPKAAT